MLEEKTYFGEWWVPSDPVKRIKGKFTFNQDNGAILDLEGTFTEYPKTIFGLSSPIGAKITLQDCVAKRPEQFWEGFILNSTYRVYANRAFIGEHFNLPENVKFTSLSCQMSNFFEWIGKSGVRSEGEASKEVLIKYNRPDTISILINPELTINIDFRHSLSFQHRNGEISLKQFAYVSFHPRQNTNVDNYINWIHHFRNFLCLATQVAVFPQEIIGLIDNKLPSPLVDVLFQLDAPINTETTVYNSLFFFNDVESKFDKCLQNWYAKSEILEPVCELYFGSLYGRFVYLNLKFLCLVQALEAYHRRTVSNEEITKQKHKERIASILNTVPAEHKKWLQGKLVYSNEPNLRNRLKDICEIFSSTTNALISDRKYFVNKVVDTRNFMIHHDPKLKEGSVEGKELFIISEKLRIMIEMCLMKEIGFRLEEIDSLICKRYTDRLKQYEQ